MYKLKTIKVHQQQIITSLVYKKLKMKGKRVCSYQVQCINSKGAVLMIWINMCIFVFWSFVPSGNIYSEMKEVQYNYYEVTHYLILTLQIFYPLFGWIADAWIGRYRAILYGLYSLILGCAFLTLSFIIKEFESLISHITLYTSTIVNSLGIAIIYANTLPFITDQLIGASGDELSAAVHWWYWSQIFPITMAYNTSCILKNTPQILTSIFLSFTGLAIGLSNIFLGQHLLNKTPQITNPIKNIANVLNYARKNNYPRNRSALTYWEQDVPSRLDLGKNKYGGPFSEEEIENVKTSLILVPIIFICAMRGIVVPVEWLQQHHMTVTFGKNLKCLFRDELELTHMLATFGIPLYHFIIRPLLQNMTKYTPSMLKVIGVSLFLSIIERIGMVTIETIGHLQTPNVTCMFNNSSSHFKTELSLNYYWTMTSLIWNIIGTLVFDLVINEFIIAQSPQQMKGLFFGLFYGLNGIAKVIGYNLYRPFQLMPPQSIPTSCGFYYYLTQTLLLSLVFIFFLILSKKYKLRVRNNPVNIHMIADTHITAYINQEEEYLRETDEENYSIHLSNEDIFNYYNRNNY